MSLHLTLEQIQRMETHVRKCFPEEACGILGGISSETRLVIPITNELHSPVQFRMKPEEQLHAFLELENSKLELIGIFHSHPSGPDHPSEIDLAEFCYPGVKYVVWYLEQTEWKFKGFSIDQNSYQEIEILP